MNDEEIRDIAVSVWFPVGRANFYSYTANGVLLGEDNIARSPFMNDADSPGHEELYLPRLQVSVMRRVIEVLPRSFGYRDTAHYVAGKSGSSGRRRRRPTRVTLTLDLDPAWNGVVPAFGHQRRANQPLVDAGLRTVTFSVDEDGFYVVRAPATAGNVEAIRTDPDRVQRALETHLAELFGGDFLIQWQLGLTPEELREAAEVWQQAADHGRGPEPATELRLPAGYDAPTKVYNDADGKRPRGIFTFFQLNTLFEGLFNDALTPAVFFQQRDKTKRYAAEDFGSGLRSGPMPASQGEQPDPGPGGHPDPGPELDSKPRRVPLTVADIVHLLVTRLDATEDRNNKIVTLRHFLAVTSRESLQKLKWSVESVRRGLLDEMMSVLHRQSKLIQVKLEPLGHHEWAPEVATGANESQLRGYVMLVGAKLPLVVNVHRYAKAAMHYLLEAAGSPSSGATAQQQEPPPVRTVQQRNADDLVYRVKEWRGLVNALQESVRGLEKAVEHAWMERLLYEQEQARAEQEAMAEIQRVRSARPVADGVIGGQSAVMLFVTILAAVAAVAAVQPGSGGDWWPSTWAELQTWLGAGAFVLVPLTFVLIGQLIRRLRTARVGYEFAFRLELNVLTSEVFKDLSAPAVERGRASGGRQPGPPAPYRFPDQVYRPLRRVRLDRRGGARIEYASRDSTLVKVHHGVSFRVGWLGRRAHFEIINEFLARDVSERDEYYLRETRVFGEAPRALTPAETFGLLVFVLNRTALCYQTPVGDQLRAEDVLRKAGMLFFTLEPPSPPKQPPTNVRPSPAPRQRTAGETEPTPALES